MKKVWKKEKKREQNNRKDLSSSTSVSGLGRRIQRQKMHLSAIKIRNFTEMWIKYDLGFLFRYPFRAGLLLVPGVFCPSSWQHWRDDTVDASAFQLMSLHFQNTSRFHSQRWGSQNWVKSVKFVFISVSILFTLVWLLMCFSFGVKLKFSTYSWHFSTTFITVLFLFLQRKTILLTGMNLITLNKF